MTKKSRMIDMINGLMTIGRKTSKLDDQLIKQRKAMRKCIPPLMALLRIARPTILC
jgi:hypothetical protein